MEKIPFPDVHFGEADKPLPDWRKKITTQVDPDDDEELPKTPDDVIAAYGFDPADLTE